MKRNACLVFKENAKKVMGIGHSRKNFPIMPCASLHTNNTKTNNNKKEDAEFVFQQLWKAIGLRL